MGPIWSSLYYQRRGPRVLPGALAPAARTYRPGAAGRPTATAPGLTAADGVRTACREGYRLELPHC
jgi:hypothetical protein